MDFRFGGPIPSCLCLFHPNIPLFCGAPVTKPPYTAKLQAGLGLIPETRRLLELWQPGMDGQALLRAALASGQFPTMTARRLKNIIIEAFAPRCLVDGALPARLLKTLSGNLATHDTKQLLFLYTCRANQILADFVREVYWGRYSAGSSVVSKPDAHEFIQRAVSDGITTTRWSDSTITRVASYLLGTCADFGLLGPMKNGARPFVPFRPTPLVTSFLAHDLHFKGLGDNAVLTHEDWSLFGLGPEDVLAELKRLALRGEMIVQSVGAVAQVSWKITSMEELANGIANG